LHLTLLFTIIAIIVTPETTLKMFKEDIKEVIGPKEETSLGKRKISWNHVWKNYCLIFGSTRLLENNARLIDYGIQHGSELSFAKYRKSKR
jgi:hypothetical protein